MAALIGRRFAASAAGAAVEVTGEELLACLHEAVEAQLVVPVDPAGEYAFRHALTAESLRAAMLPSERAEMSGRAARAIESTAGHRTEGWERLAGELWCAAGEPRRAAEQLLAAGRRAAEQGGVSTATSLLERGLALLAPGAVADPLVMDLTEALIDAYADAGRVADAYACAARIDRSVPAAHRAAVHLRLARVAAAAGHWADGLQEVATVRGILGPDVDPAFAARVDAVAARLTFGNPTAGRLPAAEALAGRALRAAEMSGQPDVACSALETLGRCARLRDLDEADALYRRGLALTTEHNLVNRKIRLLYHAGAHDGIRSADPTRLRAALTLANQAGAVVSALNIELELAVVQLCRGEFDAADEATRRCEETAERLRLTHTRVIALAERIFVAAHRGRRAEQDRLLARFHELGGDHDDFASAVRGFGLAIAQLLAEEPAAALVELERARVEEVRRPASYISFVHGPHLLLSVLAGRAGEAELAAVQRSAHAQAGWNRQFITIAGALLHGRAGRRAEAERAISLFEGESPHYPLARHLGLRLAAQSAIEDGWGDPVPWLRAAEAYFHPAHPRVVRACRGMLRRVGARIRQHREGSEGIPPALRERGVTVREYEVLRLVADRLDNQRIGQRLFLSPRTVEKHIANLLAKTDRRDRATLAELGASVLGVPSTADG